MSVNFMQAMPPGKKTTIRCEDCSGTTFNLAFEEGMDSLVHAACITCGKRGAIRFHLRLEKSVHFQQFMDVDPAVLQEDYAVTQVQKYIEKNPDPVFDYVNKWDPNIPDIL